MDEESGSGSRADSEGFPDRGTGSRTIEVLNLVEVVAAKEARVALGFSGLVVEV